jgi:hypothetical protein
MAITREQYVSVDENGNKVEIPGAYKLKGLPSDEKKRSSAIQKVANSAKATGGKLIRRGSDVFVVTVGGLKAGADETVKADHPITGRGRKRNSETDSLFSD